MRAAPDLGKTRSASDLEETGGAGLGLGRARFSAGADAGSQGERHFRVVNCCGCIHDPGETLFRWCRSRGSEAASSEDEYHKTKVR